MVVGATESTLGQVEGRRIDRAAQQQSTQGGKNKWKEKR